MTKSQTAKEDLLGRLVAILERRNGLYAELNDAGDFADYLARGAPSDDEEVLTELVLGDLIEELLGFPADAYMAQRSKSGLKPDFTPLDLIAHSFVLDAKSSKQGLDPHEPQIRTYMNQRQLDYGILFNLREVRVYRRAAGVKGHEPDLSFAIEPLWRHAKGEAAEPPELETLHRVSELFAYREMDREAKIAEIAAAAPWELRALDAGEELQVDVDLLVEVLRRLSGLLSDDAIGQSGGLAEYLELQSGREEAILEELKAIAQDLSPGIDEGSLPDSVAGYIAATDELPRRVWRQYMTRVAQLVLARIVLYRSWEDAGYVDESLYDGGFGEAYERLDRMLREVLRSAFAVARERYHWLYGPDNNYDWYRPREEALVEVLYSLTQFPLDRLDADVLGGLYESYVDEIDRDRLGQFYTPRSVVSFMLDRAGFDGPDGVFKIEGDERKPVRALDFASGSGGFPVEIARRIIDEGGVADDDATGLREALAAIVKGIHGVEISPFPYYLTEINMLLQVSRLLGGLKHLGAEPPQFVLSVVHEDTLTAKPPQMASLDGLEPELRGDRAELVEDKRYGLVPLDPQKASAFARIREDESFDLVVGNPPYVAEANNRVLFSRLREIDAWKGIYRGKSDYLYYFLHLAADKVARGGRLAVIVPAGWMNAGAADWLREHLAATLRIDEMFLFGSYRLFAPEREARLRRHRAPTPTVESLILIATRGEVAEDHTIRVVALEAEVEAAVALSGDPEARAPDRDALLKEMKQRASGKPGRSGGLHVHDIAQADLEPGRPWPVKHGAEDAAARVVARLQELLDGPEAAFERLGERWDIAQGIQTGADAYTPRIQARLAKSFPEAKRKLDKAEAVPGAPILELPPGRELEAPWKQHPEVLARSVEPGAILYAALDNDDYTHLVWLGRTDEADESVVEALRPWKPVLENRADFLANPERRWWETHRTRDKTQLAKPKVIALYRTDRGRFAVDEDGSWQPSIKTTLVTAKADDLSVTYLGGLLNSELLDLWYAVRGKTPWHVRRNYEPKPMAEIPYRHVAIEEKIDEKRLTKLDEALKSGKPLPIIKVADAIGADLRDAGEAGQAPDHPAAVEAARALELLVRAIADNRRALLPFRDRFPGLGRVVKDPWRTEVVDPHTAAFVEALTKKQRASVRVDPDLEVSIDTDGVLGAPAVEKASLTFTYRREAVARVKGPKAKLALLETLLAGRKGLLAADLDATEVPRDMKAFRREIKSASEEVAKGLTRGRELVEAAERLVCRLYGTPADLEQEVVEHAIDRAGRR